MIVVLCEDCRRPVAVCEETLVYRPHWAALVGVPCSASGRQVDSNSRLPSWHPRHVCGMFCDGQDGLFSKCFRDRCDGPPSAVDRLAQLAQLEGRIEETET